MSAFFMACRGVKGTSPESNSTRVDVVATDEREPDDSLADNSQWRTEACCFRKWDSRVLK